MTFDPRALCRGLNDAGVDYVVIGGLAAVVWGSPVPTADVDVVPQRSTGNLDRLVDALRRMGARLAGNDGGAARSIEVALREAGPAPVELTTPHGDLGLVVEAAGPRTSFDEWDRDAENVEIAEGLMVRVASLDAVIESKRALGRPEDERVLVYLESLADEIAEGRADEAQ